MDIKKQNYKQINAGITLAKNVWSNLSLDERKNVLYPIIDLLKSKTTLFVETLIKEIGMPKKEAIESHKNTIKRIGVILESAKDFKVVQDYGSGIVNSLIKIPRGVVLLITPSNHPVSISLWQIVPALLAGNVVLYKPSEYANESARLIEELFVKLNLPANVFSVLYGDKHIVSKAINSINLNLVVFTGSYSAGLTVNSLAARNLIPTIMELGGKDSLIITKSADLLSAVEATIVGCLRHSGQLCSSIERVYVNKSIEKEFLTLLTKKLRLISVGDPKDENTLLAKLSDPKKYSFIRSQISESIQNGGKLVIGSLSENYLGPWLLTNVSNDSSLFREETMGPVIAVRSYDSEEVLINEVNENDFGLCATIWSTEKTDLPQKLDVGTVSVNRLSGTLSQSPWLGKKKSGLGFVLGFDPLEPYTTYKNLRLKND